MIKLVSFANLLICYTWYLMDVALTCLGKENNHPNGDHTPRHPDVNLSNLFHFPPFLSEL